VFEDGESIDDFTVRMNHLITQLAVLGNSYTDEEIVRCLLNALPSRFDQIAVSIKTLLDLADVSLDELIGNLNWWRRSLNAERRIPWRN
jgi:hypothetical protein